MILTSFDPGKMASYAIFDTTRPWEVEVGEIRQVGMGRDIRPCAMHIQEVISNSDQVLLEKVGAMTKQGVTSMFTFGMCYGAIMGSVQANGKSLEHVAPQTWKAASKLSGLKDEEAKTAARLFAKQLWPQCAATFDVKGKHGCAEAALMARWYFLSGPGRAIPLDIGSPMVRPAA